MFKVNFDFARGSSPQDTGLKDANDNIIYALLLDTGALPNAGSVDVPHGVTGLSVAAGSFSGMLYSYADDGGTNLSSFDGLGVAWSLDATNLTLTTVSDLSAYTSSTAVILYTVTGQDI